jgi:bifunctional oligoribonuclease and PAP phosphatase NrnA
MDELKFQTTLQKILTANNILVTIHVRPDGDAIASACILIELLENNKKNYFAFSQDVIPHQYSFLPHTEKIKSDKSLINFSDYDLTIALDCGSISRSGLETEIKSRNPNQLFIEFDHHPYIEDVDGSADIANRYPECASTTEVLYHFLKANQITLNKNYANSILTGLLTDTDNFLFPITSDRSINIASEMLVYGAKFPQVLESTHRNKSLGAMRLWGQALSNLKINPRYKFAYTIISQEDIKEYDVSDEELENLSNFISNLNDAKGILVLQELGPNEIKGSLRATQSNLDVSRLARQLGGGGHTKAAGFRMQGKLVNEAGQWKII